MSAKFSDLFESIMSLFTTVGYKSLEKGGKSMGLAMAKKIGWASKDASVGGGIHNVSLHSHKMSGHSMVNSCSMGKRDLSNYDPKKSYQSSITSQYKDAAISGTGAGSAGFEVKKRLAKIKKEQAKKLAAKASSKKRFTPGNKPTNSFKFKPSKLKRG